MTSPLPIHGKNILKFSKEPRWRNQKWLDKLKERPCFLTHTPTNEYETVDPAHLGTGGKGMKDHDFHVMPLIHRLHHIQHTKGWSIMLEPFLRNNPWVLVVTLLKAYWYVEALKEVSGLSRYQIIKHFEELK